MTPWWGLRRLTWLTIACKINEDLHRCMLTETDYAGDHLFSRISLQIEQSIHHMQTQLTSHHSTQLTKTQSCFWSLVSSKYWNSAFNLAKLQNHSRAAHSCCAGQLLYDRWSLCEASGSIIKSILFKWNLLVRITKPSRNMTQNTSKALNQCNFCAHKCYIYPPYTQP